MDIRHCAHSDLGQSRSVNEDSFLVDQRQGLYVVSDGMGGHGNGEIASQIAVTALARYLESHPAVEIGSKAAQDRLRRAVEVANERVLAEVEKDSELSGMGATVVAIQLDGAKGLIAYVGDSRVYRFRNGTLEQLTEDHTWVHEQVSAGLLSEDDAKMHPFRSVVTRAVGGGQEVSVDIIPLEVEAGDRLLLCSDGLNAVLSDDEIKLRIQRRESLEAICQELIDAANAGGGPDNITVVLLEAPEDQP